MIAAALIAVLAVAARAQTAARPVFAEAAPLIQALEALRLPRPLPEPQWSAFEAHRDEVARHGASAQALFDRTRDVSCPRKDESCLRDLESLTVEFEALTQAIVRFHAFTDGLARDPVLERLSDDDKRALRSAYSKALKLTVVWVHGLDDLLNMKWGRPAARRRLERSQDRLFRALDPFNAARNAFALRVKDLIWPWPAPSPALRPRSS